MIKQNWTVKAVCKESEHAKEFCCFCYPLATRELTDENTGNNSEYTALAFFVCKKNSAKSRLDV